MTVKIAAGCVPQGIAQIQLESGQQVTLDGIGWQEYETILEDLGEHRHSHISYYRGVLEIRMPLPEHERFKVLISNLLVILLEELGLEWESLGSTTFKHKRMMAGIEPDDCFYIQNYAAMIGKKRLDLDFDPVPELAIEVDLTSKTKVSAYEGLGVPEVWRVVNDKLEINLLRDGKYITSEISDAFPSIPIAVGISEFIEKSKNFPLSALRREFKVWVQHQLNLAN